jgi:hypothetical protein
MSPVIVRFILWMWFGLALAAGKLHWLQAISTLAVQGIVLGLTTILLVLYFVVPPVRKRVDQLELRTLVLLHLTRFVGIYFLVLHARGELPRELAIPAGIGDIIVATMVLPVVFAPLEPAHRLRAITVWNVVGFVDLLLVIGTITRINLTDPARLRPFTELPLSLLPTFLVPILLASHIVIFVRTARERVADTP